MKKRVKGNLSKDGVVEDMSKSEEKGTDITGLSLNPRQRAVVEGMAEGESFVKSMLKAGYSESHSYKIASGNGRSPLLLFKQRYDQEYARELKRRGFGGKEAASIISDIAQNGKRDFDKLQAVKLNHLIINADRVLNSTTIATGVFIIPESVKNAEDWNEKVRAYKQKAIKVDTQE